MIITYTALRSLIDTHTAGIEYTQTVKLTTFAETRTPNRVRNTMLDGSVFDLTHFVKEKFSFKTQILEADELDQFREFISSVEYGETFTITNPDTDETVAVKLDSFSPSRMFKKLNSFKYSITVIAA